MPELENVFLSMFSGRRGQFSDGVPKESTC